jgi:excisionase family DNA binding protein
MEPSNGQQVLMPREVAAIMRVHVHTVGRWVRDGKLECFRTGGGHMRFRREVIEAALKKEGR